MKAKKRDVKLSFAGMSVRPAQEVRQRGHECRVSNACRSKKWNAGAVCVGAPGS